MRGIRGVIGVAAAGLLIGACGFPVADEGAAPGSGSAAPQPTGSTAFACEGEIDHTGLEQSPENARATPREAAELGVSHALDPPPDSGVRLVQQDPERQLFLSGHGPKQLLVEVILLQNGRWLAAELQQCAD